MKSKSAVPDGTPVFQVDITTRRIVTLSSRFTRLGANEQIAESEARIQHDDRWNQLKSWGATVELGPELPDDFNYEAAIATHASVVGTLPNIIPGSLEIGGELVQENPVGSLPELSFKVTATSQPDKARIILALRTLATQIEEGKLVWRRGGIHINGDAERGPLYVKSDLKFGRPESQVN